MRKGLFTLLTLALLTAEADAGCKASGRAKLFPRATVRRVATVTTVRAPAAAATVPVSASGCGKNGCPTR